MNLTGGATPYSSISWTSSDPSFSDPGGNLTSLVNLDSGSYSVTVIDANGCQYDTTLIITKPSEIFANGVPTDVVCFNDADGTITLNTSSGAGGYSWSWSSTNPSFVDPATENLTNLDVGTYTVTITDVNGCTKDSSFTIDQPDDINISLDLLENVDCNGNGNGIINVTLTGGTTPLSPSWTIITPVSYTHLTLPTIALV